MHVNLSPRMAVAIALFGVVALVLAATRVFSPGDESFPRVALPTAPASQAPALPPPPPSFRQAVRPERFPATGLPYSPGILVRGETLYLSGQLGRDPATAALVPGGIEAETRQALVNLGEVLREAGMGYADVVSVTAFLTDFADFPKYNEVYREFFPTDPPARATVQVAGLNLDARIEIQMIAARPAR